MNYSYGQISNDKKHTILLVDDEEFILDIGQGFLEILGYDVIVAQGGHAAIDIFTKEQDKILLIIIDLSMPILDGQATFRELRKINPQVKVLLSTGHYIDDKIYELMEKGAAGILQKPFTIDKLSHELNKILDK